MIAAEEVFGLKANRAKTLQAMQPAPSSRYMTEGEQGGRTGYEGGAGLWDNQVRDSGSGGRFGRLSSFVERRSLDNHG